MVLRAARTSTPVDTSSAPHRRLPDGGLKKKTRTAAPFSMKGRAVRERWICQWRMQKGVTKARADRSTSQATSHHKRLARLLGGLRGMDPV